MRSYLTLGSILLGTTILTTISTYAFAAPTGILDSAVAANGNGGTLITYTVGEDQLIKDNAHPTGIQLQNNAKLTINGANAAPKVFGSIGLSSGTTLNVNNVGGIASGTSIDPNTYDVTLAGYWTSSQDGATSANIPALVNDGGSLSIYGTVFANSHNTSTSTTGVNGGAIKLDANSTTSIDTSLFYNNQSDGFGGAIDADNPTAVITKLNNSYFIKNNAADHGGAIDLHGTIQQMFNTQFAKNAGPQGGALYVHGGGSVTNASQNVFVENEAAQGAAIYAVANSTVSMSNSTFKNNIAHNGGDDTIPVGGGAVFNDGTFTSSQNLYTGNQAQNNGKGGAIYNDSNATLTSTGDSFQNNTAAQNGGAIVNASTANIQNGTFNGNTSGQNGGAIANITATAGSGTVTGTTTISGNSSFTNNTATGNGGAIYNSGNLNLEGNGITFSGNTAALGSAIYNDTDGIVNLNSINDTIDLDYSPYTSTPFPGTSHVTFANGEDIYNAGTLNINSSNLQLHTGINTKNKNKSGTVNLNNSRVDLGTNVVYGDTVNINDGSKLLTHIDIGNNNFGHVEANDITVADQNTTLTIVVQAGTHLAEGESKEYNVLDASNGVNGEFTDISKNKLYTITAKGDGVYELKREGEVCVGDGCDENENNTLNGWINGDSMAGKGNDVATDIQNKLNDLAQTVGCESDEFRDALDGLAPDVSPLIQAHATEITRRLSSIISNRLYSSMERTGYVHRDKRFYKFPRHNSNLWVQGMYGKSKYDTRKGWDMDTKGVAIGFDGHVSEALRMGLGYAYTMADGPSVQRDTDIKSHTAMFYGEYNPNRFYTNWLVNYTRSNYDETKKVFNHRLKAEYDVDAIGAQIMLGEKMGPFVVGDWASGVLSPEIGARYIYTKQHSYTDEAGQSVGSADGQTLTGILGAQYTIGYTISPTLAWYPELRAALTYDFVEPDTKTRVNLINGSTYQVTTDQMDRFGIEVGARVGLDINRKAEVSLEYEGLFKGDYTNHTGLANLKYKF